MTDRSPTNVFSKKELDKAKLELWLRVYASMIPVSNRKAAALAANKAVDDFIDECRM